MINIREFLNLTYYTSPSDRFLNEYDESHKKLSASQRAEIEKYARIYKLRDKPAAPLPKETLWDKF